jgi:predicted dehydrogenase
MTDPSARLQVAMVGAGMISEFHLKAWARLVDAEVVAVVDPDLPRASARAEAFGIPRVYPDLDACLAEEEIEALDVASPRQTHASLVRRAAADGIHVLCQKPLAPTFAEAEGLVRDVDGRLRLMVHENWRFRPYYRQIGRWIREGRLGQLGSCTISIRSSGLLPDAAGRYPSLERQPFFRTEERLLVAETLIHHVDVARWLFGPLQLVGARLLRTSQAVVGETVATLLLEDRAGAPIVVDGNLTCPKYPPYHRDRVEIIGASASIVMAEDRLTLRGDDPCEFVYEHAAAYQESFDAAVAHFVSCLRSGQAFETNAGDNLETLRLVEQCYNRPASRQEGGR